MEIIQNFMQVYMYELESIYRQKKKQSNKSPFNQMKPIQTGN